MKRKILSLLLMMFLLLNLFTGTTANTTLCFVAVNDTIPLTLSDGSAPYYNKGVLYLPYTAFQANPNGVGASYSAERGTFVLFNSKEMLIFDLEAGTYTDNAEQVYEVALAYRGGTLYVPAKVATHFDLSVTMLTSRNGYPIIRFTNGEQVYEDGTFVAQAENLINHVAEEYQKEDEQQSDLQNENAESTEGEEPEAQQSPEIYLAFAGDSVSEDTVKKLAEHNIHAAFFFTETQITLKRDLVRTIYAYGHTIGVTISGQVSNIHAALAAANRELDDVLFCKTVLALLPEGSSTEDASFHILLEPYQSQSVEQVLSQTDTPQLYVVRSGALGVIESFVNGEATLHQLLETSF